MSTDPQPTQPSSPAAAPTPVHRKSNLPQLGILLILVGLFTPRMLTGFAKSLGDDSGQLSSLQRSLLFGTDLLRLCFFIGLALLIIGLIRNRKSK